MTYVIINPGTGYVANATKAQAAKNMKAFVAAVSARLGKDPQVTFTDDYADEGGRYSFTLLRGNARCPVDMPGVSLDELRGSTMYAPRLYVDGSSWWWKYAVDAACDELNPEKAPGREKP